MPKRVQVAKADKLDIAAPQYAATMSSSAATADQTAGINLVGDSVAELDRVTQQNAALVEESAAASASLKEQADSLIRAVDVFKLREER